MSYVSNKYPNEFVIDESNSHIYAPNQNVQIKNIRTGDWESKGRGLTLPSKEGRHAARAAIQGFLKPWDRPVFSRDVIREKIKERETKGKILSQLLREKKIPASDQNGLNYCWGYGPHSAVNAMRVWRNLPYIEWSREFVCAPLKNGSNSGGWGLEALERMVEVGMLPQQYWPQHSRKVSYNTPENRTIAADYKITEFLVLEDDNFLQLMTALVEDLPVAVGYNWWSHEVCGVDPVIIGSTDLGIRIWNSWGDGYGDHGFAILNESKATPDDAVIPVVQIAA